MQWHERLRQILGSTVYAAQLMVAGAWVFANYLEWRGPIFPQMRELESGLMLAFFVLMFADRLLRPAPAGPSLKEPSPRQSGTWAVVATGFAATLALKADLVAAVSAAFTTLIAAVLVWRFASVRGKEIGEARFDTVSRTTD